MIRALMILCLVVAIVLGGIVIFDRLGTVVTVTFSPPTGTR